MTIWKFSLPVADRCVLSMPAGARVLCVQTQDGYPCIWAMVDPDKPNESRLFMVRGTGHEMGDAVGMPYIGTFQMEQGQLVFHVFDGGLQ